MVKTENLHVIQLIHNNLIGMGKLRLTMEGQWTTSVLHNRKTRNQDSKDDSLYQLHVLKCLYSLLPQITLMLKSKRNFKNNFY